ncbi:MAG: bifunctional diaminohydroxyphosphoribosylaminopyrimidine deaminase/5-amino-6-(5-phosphoribosylamino)uracil reductase RibD [Phycisphaerales bacterium]|nr:bifunctional diaminohydroxyphosphoribosylaminopyrimidine deaminase/5-amino-6-(5-phosphoribosylamino)uracil reductase RibD [Phycisphaerales bacterium]
MNDPTAKAMLDLAARAAFRGMGNVEPNPLVGCVIVRPGAEPVHERVIGIGHHRVYGGPHAEVDALARCRALGNDPTGATAYVTLEPCNGHGKNPPCVKALVEARIAKVVCAARDETDGKGHGAAALRAVGIPCEFTSVSQRATDLSEPWRHRMRTRLPWVIAKWAQTIDGKLATGSGDSKWISNERSRLRVHRIRAAVDAVMVGGRTVEVDDPMLTARGVPLRRRATRVVVSPSAGLALDRVLAATAPEHATVLVCGANCGEGAAAAGVKLLRIAEHERSDWLRDALVALRREHGVHTLLVEGGARLLGGLIARGLVNEAHVHTGPVVLGDGNGSGSINSGEAELARVGDGQRWRLLSVRRAGDDVQSVYRRRP